MSPNNTKIFETENTRFPIGYLAGGKQVGYLKAWPKELNLGKQFLYVARVLQGVLTKWAKPGEIDGQGSCFLFIREEAETESLIAIRL